ncbi:hypothetical protein, partial [Stenotrophomonas forensis]|uniref:hypothetical protein n=1 Tax=Stenotrophomonas forensis TaxID=2871169 RepID=UPI0039C6985B
SATAWMPWPSPQGRVYGVSRHLYPSRLRSFPGDGRQEQWITDELKENKKDAAFAASFLFDPALLRRVELARL